MSERQEMFEDQERQRLAAELANKQAREAREREIFEQRQQARVVPKVTPRPVTPPPTITKTTPIQRRGAAFKPKKTITDVANSLFRDANLPTVEQQREAIRTIGISAARQLFKPTTIKEAKARLGLVIVEPLIGGAEEATLGFGSQSASRPETLQLRIVGAIATPTAADFAVGWALSKLGITKVGKAIIKKVDDFLTGKSQTLGLTADQLDELRQLSKIEDLDKLEDALKKINPDTLSGIEEISDFYRKNPAQFSAGASVIPEPVFIFENIADDLSLEADDLILLINQNKDLFADGTIITALISTLSQKDAVKVLSETTNLSDAQISSVVSEIKSRSKTRSELFEEAKSRIIVEPTITPIQVQAQTQAQIQQTTKELLTEPVLTEVITTPTVILGKPEREKRNKINLPLFRGRKQKYQVTFFFTTTEKEVKVVEARSFPSAVNKAQRGRRPRKKQPKLIDIVKIK